jgi:hypothetical protein
MHCLEKGIAGEIECIDFPKSFPLCWFVLINLFFFLIFTALWLDPLFSDVKKSWNVKQRN